LIKHNGARALAGSLNGSLVTLQGTDLPTDPLAILSDPDLAGRAKDALRNGPELDPKAARFALPLARIGKIICVGLNYADHAAESPYAKPDYPVYFLRVATSLIAHGAPIIRPRVSTHLDFEGELVAVIGKGGRAIPQARALDHVVAYSLFNDASIRDYQFKGPQWTLGKNFDGTGAFGPFLVPAAELSPGATGLTIRTRLNGETMQDANTNDLLFPIAELIAKVSEAMTLEAGDILVTGTPAGVGFARKPPLFMKDGDVVEVEVEGVGVLTNPVRDEAA
jgi:2-keto-4-pentenoate hydratase/2-oxohepta-3-ene-1,7-dioic acid hydratase in catechol pathway